MRYIISDTVDPYFNLATEEHLLKNFKEDIFYLYRNAPSIIVGKNQNTMSEINYEYVTSHRIPVVRRLSGGGAVFHDLGNLNFCFIADKSNILDASFQSFTHPIINALVELGIKAEFSGRNDITIEGLKCSGNAQYFYKNKILHHGTLLFSASIEDLSNALKVKESKIEGRGIKSYSSRVTNISKHLPHPMTIENFVEFIFSAVIEGHESQVHILTTEDRNAITDLVENKYETYEYVYGNIKEYSYTTEIKYEGGHIELYMLVQNGVIKDIRFCGDYFSVTEVSELEAQFKERLFERSEIESIIKKVDLTDYFKGITEETFISLFTK